VGTPITITDINGRTVLNTEITSNNSINIENLVKGVYFVQFEIEEKEVNYKVIKN
jgi:hypothetical protein